MWKFLWWRIATIFQRDLVGKGNQILFIFRALQNYEFCQTNMFYVSEKIICEPQMMLMLDCCCAMRLIWWRWRTKKETTQKKKLTCCCKLLQTCCVDVDVQTYWKWGDGCDCCGCEDRRNTKCFEQNVNWLIHLFLPLWKMIVLGLGGLKQDVDRV